MTNTLWCGKFEWATKCIASLVVSREASMKTPRIAGIVTFFLLFIMAEALFAQGPKPLPTKCNDKSQGRVQPVWLADTANLHEPKACINMNGRLVFQESLRKPTFILLTEQYLVLTFPQSMGPVVIS